MDRLSSFFLRVPAARPQCWPTTRRVIRRLSRIAVAVLSLTLLPLHDVLAFPNVTSTSLFTDNRPFDDPFGIFGYNLALSAQISDPLGVPSNIRSVTATNLSTSEVQSLPFAAGEQAVFPGLYLRFTPFSPSHLGTWQIQATNQQGETAFRNSHSLDKPMRLEFPRGIVAETIADTVLASFNPVPNADSYALEIYRETPVGLAGVAVFNSTLPSFSIPTSTFDPSQRYLLRARAQDLDFSESGAPVENRSVNAVPFALDRSIFTASIISSLPQMLSLPSFQAVYDRLIACPSDPSCDIDQANRDFQAVQLQTNSITKQVTTDSIPLVLDPKPIPTSAPELLQKLILKAEFYVDVLSDIFSALLFDNQSSSFGEIAPLSIASQSSGPSVGAVTIDGIFGDFTLDGRHFDFLDAEITAEIDKSLLPAIRVGDQFFNELSFFDQGRAFGIATVTGVVDPPQFGVVTIALRQVEIATVPQSSSLILCVAGILLIAVLRRRSIAR